MARTTILATMTALSLATALLLVGCPRPRPITVGSKNFTEQVLLGEIAAQQLERRLGVTVSRKLNLGGTLLAHEALVAGQIDLYPEYTGTALTAVLKLPLQSDPKAVWDRVKAEYQIRWKLLWLAPLGFNDTFAMVIRGEDARAERISTLSQAARRIEGWRLGVGYEFQGRPDGLPGLQKTYALPLRGSPASMDLGLLYTALSEKRVDMVAANSTDGLLSARDFKVLDDDRRYFPPYEAAFVLSRMLEGREPKARKALEELSGTLSNDVMQRLNNRVDGEHRSVAAVAREFLEHGNPAAPAKP